MARLATTCVFAFTILLAIAVLAGCAEKDVKYAKQIKAMESADVAAEVEAAVSKGDLRFVGVMGFALIVPGVPDYHEKYAAKYGVRVIENTSDVIVSERLQNVAYRYAEKYNRLLIARLPKS